MEKKPAVEDRHFGKQHQKTSKLKEGYENTKSLNIKNRDDCSL